MTKRERPYTLQFALEATGISSQTLRHWRKVLPPLRGRSAHRPCFSAGDLLALRVLDAWVNGLGCKVSRLQVSSSALFALCTEEAWSRIEQSLLAHDLATDTWELIADGTPMRWSNGVVVLPIGMLAAELSERLIGNPSSPQTSLEFPLMQITAGASRMSRSVKGGAQ